MNFLRSSLGEGPIATSGQLRLVAILPTYIPESFGGAEQHSRKLAAAWARSGCAVTILAPRLKGGTKAREDDGPVRIRRFKLAHAPNLGGRHLLSFLAWSWKLTAWLVANRGSYDVINIVHGRLHALPAVLAGRLLAKPVIVKIGRGGAHFDIAIVRTKFLYGPLAARLIAAHTTAWVANSAQIVADLLAWNIDESRIFRIPNGVDVPDDRPRAFDPSAITFVYFGRFDPEKALDRMIRVFAKLGGRARLVLVGDGACEWDLRSLISDGGLAPIVEIQPPVTDVEPLLREATFFISTSQSEGMSNAMLEAMAHGVPPVVSRVSGVDDVVENGTNGLVFDGADESDILRALEAATALNAGQYADMSRSAAAAIRARFDIVPVAARYLEVCRKYLT